LWDALEGGHEQPTGFGVSLAFGLQLISEIMNLAAQGLE
jgi:hypothetical protein